MIIRYSPSKSAFYIAGIHPQIPSDAVEITLDRHRELLDAQADGAEIFAGPDGFPVAVTPSAPPLEQRRTNAIAATKREATRRIELIAPVWRQMNALREGGAIDWPAIDAIRAASDALEATIDASSAEQLAALDIASNDNWPAIAAA